MKSGSFQRFFILLILPVMMNVTHAGTLHCLPSVLEGKSKFDTIPLAEENLKQIDEQNRVPYLDTPEKRAPYKVTIKNGLFYDAKGKLLNDPDSLYVMDQNGDFYQALENFYQPLSHSSFFAGENVAAAGIFRASKGKLKYIDSSSGHYLPNYKIFVQALESLAKQGVDLKGVGITLGGNKNVRMATGRFFPEKDFMAESLLYADPKSLECVEATLKNSKEATAEDFLLMERLDHEKFKRVVSEIETEGRIAEYESTLKSVFKKKPWLRKVISEKSKGHFPPESTWCQITNFLKTIVGRE